MKRLKVSLNNCDREQVHIPGAIQPHGILFRLDPRTHAVTNVSTNVERLVGIAPATLIGADFASIIKDFDSEKFQFSDLAEGEKRWPTDGKFNTPGSERTFSFEVHLYRGNLLVEVEPKVADESHFFNFSKKASMALATVRNSKTLADLSQALVNQIRTLTGFDRVVLYKFDRDWNGHVIAESRTEEAESYLDLYFPATDIPSQVRALFTQNRLRVIPTSHFEPAPLFPDALGAERAPIDMSFCNLRNVSPIHIEYLKNMQVNASMSVSILKDGQLWGLISCSQEKEPKQIAPEIRSTAEFLADTFSTLLPVHDTDIDYISRARFQEFHNQLLTQMTNEASFVDGLLSDEAALLGVAGACGAAISVGNVWHTVGICPDLTSLKSIIDRLKGKIKDRVFVSDKIVEDVPELQATPQAIAGIAIFTTSQAQTNYFCWFKPEVIQTVKWGGDPNKRPEREGDLMILHPRKSFETWKEIVKHRSLPWTKEEFDSLSRLRHSIIEIVLQRIERITTLNTELERSNNELDSFAYAASHDMKEPLRGIHNYAAMVLRDSSGKLEPQSQSRLESILRLTQRSEDLINSLLHYAQIGRAEFVFTPVNLNDLIANALDSIRNLIDGNNVKFQIAQLPTVLGDRVQLMEVFTNLIGNAIKYNTKSHKQVTIRSGSDPESPDIVRIEIEDNGIGIESVHRDSIFKIFKRLHGKAEFGGGSGTGLTIAKKVVERHGGNIWIRTGAEGGTVFLFTLRRVSEK